MKSITQRLVEAEDLLKVLRAEVFGAVTQAEPVKRRKRRSPYERSKHTPRGADIQRIVSLSLGGTTEISKSNWPRRPSPLLAYYGRKNNMKFSERKTHTAYIITRTA